MEIPKTRTTPKKLKPAKTTPTVKKAKINKKSK